MAGIGLMIILAIAAFKYYLICYRITIPLLFSIHQSYFYFNSKSTTILLIDWVRLPFSKLFKNYILSSSLPNPYNFYLNDLKDLKYFKSVLTVPFPTFGKTFKPSPNTFSTVKFLLFPFLRLNSSIVPSVSTSSVWYFIFYINNICISAKNFADSFGAFVRITLNPSCTDVLSSALSSSFFVFRHVVLGCPSNK